MPTIFDGMNETVDRCLLLNDSWPGTSPRFGHLATLLRLRQSPPRFSNENLIDQLYQCSQTAWQSAPIDQRECRSAENWRSTKRLECRDDNPSQEAVLERLLVRLADDDWWNQVPVDSGLLNSQGRRKVDLVNRRQDRFTLMELKVNSNTPLSAAIQVLQNGVAYLFFRQCVLPELSIRDDAKTPAIMHASGLDLVVLAPASYYDRFDDSRRWLESFEREMETQLSTSTIRQSVGIPMTFRFESFPQDFTWSIDLASDASQHQLISQALDRRERAFPAGEACRCA